MSAVSEIACRHARIYNECSSHNAFALSTAARVTSRTAQTVGVGGDMSMFARGDRDQRSGTSHEGTMRTWILWVLGTIITGVVVYWLTEGSNRHSNANYPATTTSSPTYPSPPVSETRTPPTTSRTSSQTSNVVRPPPKWDYYRTGDWPACDAPMGKDTERGIWIVPDGHGGLANMPCINQSGDVIRPHP